MRLRTGTGYSIWSQVACHQFAITYNPLDMARLHRLSNVWLVVPAVLAFFYFALDSMVDDSPTMDEQNHMARGLAFLRTGDPRLSLEHPPLVNTLSALPLLTMPEIDLPLDHPSWQKQPPDVYWYVFAEQFLWQHDQDVDRLVFLARMPVVFLTLGLALVGYLLASSFWRRPSGLFAFYFLLFDPNLLAHGRYSTTDMGGTTFILLATWLLWRLWQADSQFRRDWPAAVLGLGLAFASKLSALIFVPIWALLALVPAEGEGTWSGSRIWRREGQLISAGLAALVVVWLLYGLEWGPFFFRSSLLSLLNQYEGPMPTFWAGIEKIFVLVSAGQRPAFLLGQFSANGFTSYFPVAFLAKTPLPWLLLLPVAASWLLRLKATRQQALFLLLPVVLYFSVSMWSALNIGYRHLLPILPFLLVLLSGLAHHQPGLRRGVLAPRMGQPGLLLVVALVAVLATDICIHPHYLSFFNRAAGGPDKGRDILIDSNIDWGQDLLRLQAWMRTNGVSQLKLGWFGTADPAYYGLPHEPLPGFPRQPYHGLWTDPPFDLEAPEPGIYAISVSSLWEPELPDKRVYAWFRARTPDDRIGYSIMIYRVE